LNRASFCLTRLWYDFQGIMDLLLSILLHLHRFFLTGVSFPSRSVRSFMDPSLSHLNLPLKRE
jgi:hypothetical protein